MSYFDTYRSKLIQLQYDHAALAFEWAMIRFGRALDRAIRAEDAALDHAFNPNQPRVPAGSPDGGQWTDGDNVGVIPVADNDRLGGERYLNPHIMDRHVGISDAELIARVEGETRRGWFFSKIIDRDGSFASVEDARDLIKRTLDMNPEAVARVARNQSPWEFLTHRFGFETGREAYREQPDSEIIWIRSTYGVGVRIDHDPKSELGYRVRTAYPRNFNPRYGR